MSAVEELKARENLKAKYVSLLGDLGEASAREYGAVWMQGLCGRAATAIRELIFLAEVDREHAMLGQSVAADNAAEAVYASLAKGFDVLDADGEAVAFRARYCFEGGDRSVGIPDASWFEVVPQASPSSPGGSET